ncbi:hypothetical protein T440DRAFT_481436 [Plenodomus tracheiphilus IPT5]|uniref:UBZ4-type domain-containing protein n=1 Tax=Plenodomus tracheiphilus IPT5 TaxID=1408161 RepID=A0A6A7B0E8_9PLEO|nr:hypothetical protein T440DRAFT_481436 [Plenodomus tracheiphilus IPT5]
MIVMKLLIRSLFLSFPSHFLGKVRVPAPASFEDDTCIPVDYRAPKQGTAAPQSTQERQRTIRPMSSSNIVNPDPTKLGGIKQWLGSTRGACHVPPALPQLPNMNTGIASSPIFPTGATDAPRSSKILILENVDILESPLDDCKTDMKESPPPLADAFGSTSSSHSVTDRMLSRHGHYDIRALEKSAESSPHSICIHCCVQLEVPPEERKAENVMKKHVAQCVSQGVSGSDVAVTLSAGRSHIVGWNHALRGKPFQRKTDGVSYGLRRPNRPQSCPRGIELCAALLQDVEAKDRRISVLERDPVLPEANNALLQKDSDRKMKSFENIIETLIGITTQYNATLPRSLQKRLQTDCPRLMDDCLHLSRSQQLKIRQYRDPRRIPVLVAYNHP